MNEIVKALIDFDARVSTFKVWIVLISHKHGEDVELYSEYPDKKFLNKIKMRFDTEGNDDCTVNGLYNCPLSQISTMKDNKYDYQT